MPQGEEGRERHRIRSLHNKTYTRENPGQVSLPPRPPDYEGEGSGAGRVAVSLSQAAWVSR
jgi:hypothetical protein